jgi:hypothetical protein
VRTTLEVQLHLQIRSEGKWFLFAPAATSLFLISYNTCLYVGIRIGSSPYKIRRTERDKSAVTVGVGPNTTHTSRLKNRQVK